MLEKSSVREKIDYDVIVIGGGPAGCTFVRSLITLNSRLRVLLIDKDRFPRDKICGDGLSYQAIPSIRKVFPELASLTPSASFSGRQTLCYPGGHCFERNEQVLDVIPRIEFDNALWEATVKAGAETIENARVTGLITRGERVCGVQMQNSHGVRELSCRLVVAADGSRSVVRRATGPTADDYVIHALRQYVRGLPDSTEGMIISFDLEHRGYFWIFPFVRDGERWANVGYGNATDNTILKQRFRDYLEMPEIQKYLGNAQLEGNLSGFPLNMAKFKWNGRLNRPLSGPGYLLLGDAAALIHPLSGEGIAFAIDSGAIAAEVLTDDRIPEANKGATYERRVLRRVRPAFLSPAEFCAIKLPMLLPRPLSRALIVAVSHARKVVRLLWGSVWPGSVDTIDQKGMSFTILPAGGTLAFLSIVLAGFWILYAFGVRTFPSVYTFRANLFIGLCSVFCLLDSIGRYGWPFAWRFLLCTLVGSSAVESVAIITGRIFGNYHYNPAMQAKLFGILPTVVPFGWFIFSYLAFATARELLRKDAPLLLRAALATTLLLAYDLVFDPNQVFRGVWSYFGNGSFYGVPPQNFVAWGAFGFLIMLTGEFFHRRKRISSENVMLPPLPLLALVGVFLHEGLYSLVISKYSGPALIAFVTTLLIVTTWFVRSSRSHRAQERF